MHRLTALELLERLRGGETSCFELVRMYLARIEEYNGKLNAVACIAPDALEAARRLDEAGDRALPLYGLPILVKDNIDVAGLPTTAGSPALAGNIAASDAPVIANLRKNGAVILGKTNMTEFANYTTQGMPNGFSALGGQVVSFYGPGKDPGGSSTGSAVAVSAGLCAAAIGTDTLYSVVGCATENGVAGFKPAHGSLAGDGIVPICRTLDSAGVLAKCVEDAQLVYSGMRDAPLSPAPSIEPCRLRLGVNIAGRENVSEAQLARYDALLDRLRAAGAQITEVCHESTRDHRHIMRGEFRDDLEKYLAASNAEVKTLAGIIAHYEADPARMPYGITLLRDALHGDPEYPAAMAAREVLKARYIDDIQNYDAILTTGACHLMHLIGLPSVAIKLGLADDSLPRGAILYGADEARLLAAAAYIEKTSVG